MPKDEQLNEHDVWQTERPRLQPQLNYFDHGLWSPCDIHVQVADGKDAGFAEAVQQRKPYYQKRIELFEQYHQREEAATEAAQAANVPIKVTLPDGAVKDGVQGVTTPLDVANQISKSLAKKVVVAKVDDEVWDLFRPLAGDCRLSLHTFDDADGKEVCLRKLLTLVQCKEMGVLVTQREHGCGWCYYAREGRVSWVRAIVVTKGDSTKSTGHAVCMSAYQ